MRAIMQDAWIVAADPALASETASCVAELGYTPRRARANGGRPTIDDGGSSRQPGIVLVCAAPGEPVPARVCEMLAEDETFASVPIVLAVDAEHLAEPEAAEAAHELIVRPFTAAELAARIRRARGLRGGDVADGDLIAVGTLELNLATYQVTVGGRPVDFTYMEYELLKFLLSNPSRVYSREALLSAVWGYDYYGGARTVDVHVRRLRAKLGQEHAARIRTVRGVGYRFER